MNWKRTSATQEWWAKSIGDFEIEIREQETSVREWWMAVEWSGNFVDRVIWREYFIALNRAQAKAYATRTVKRVLNELARSLFDSGVVTTEKAGKSKSE